MYFKVEFKLLLKCKASYYWKRKANANWVRSYIACAFLPNSMQQKSNTVLIKTRHRCGRPTSPSDPSELTAAVLGWGFWSRLSPLVPVISDSLICGRVDIAAGSIGAHGLWRVYSGHCSSVCWWLERGQCLGGQKALRDCCPCVTAGGNHVCSLNILFGVALLNASLISSGSRAPWDPFWFLCFRQSSLMQCQSSLRVFFF